ncbi:hypothetical protein Pan258_41380 [Symmachiella dynata]|uniref:Uncharacterized protein n=2 Tax=Symmachiella dynata TaxID=2527995 RepID=A0A517ZTL5_9PLAN|nr:hypothetical protein [Symmachiella dynata]QDT50082.1 hypothetical protein Pan258_41380 [Symmachiella dynata]QDU45809.1 hypothetical protein Mal52_43050 [Symmachiella dynata]
MMLLLPAEKIAKRLQTPQPNRNTSSTKGEIAEYRDEEISDLPDNELIAAIRAAQLPYLSQRFEDRLEYCDRDVLERLVHLARHCCRNQGH